MIGHILFGGIPGGHNTELYRVPRVTSYDDFMPAESHGAPKWMASADKKAMRVYDLPPWTDEFDGNWSDVVVADVVAESDENVQTVASVTPPGHRGGLGKGKGTGPKAVQEAVHVPDGALDDYVPPRSGLVVDDVNYEVEHVNKDNDVGSLLSAMSHPASFDLTADDDVDDIPSAENIDDHDDNIDYIAKAFAVYAMKAYVAIRCFPSPPGYVKNKEKLKKRMKVDANMVASDAVWCLPSHGDSTKKSAVTMAAFEDFGDVHKAEEVHWTDSSSFATVRCLPFYGRVAVEVAPDISGDVHFDTSVGWWQLFDKSESDFIMIMSCVWIPLCGVYRSGSPST